MILAFMNGRGCRRAGSFSQAAAVCEKFLGVSVLPASRRKFGLNGFKIGSAGRRRVGTLNRLSRLSVF